MVRICIPQYSWKFHLGYMFPILAVSLPEIWAKKRGTNISKNFTSRQHFIVKNSKYLESQRVYTVTKNLQKLKFQWIFIDGVDWKSYIVDFPTTSSTHIHWNLNVRRFFSISVGRYGKRTTLTLLNSAKPFCIICRAGPASCKNKCCRFPGQNNKLLVFLPAGTFDKK